MDDTQPARQSFGDRVVGFIEARGAGDRLILKLVGVIFLLALIWLAASASMRALMPVPEYGGVLREGIVGTPRFINPILAVTTADKDASALIYSGLMRRGEDGGLTTDVADSVSVSDDGRVYSVTLRDDVTFHDGTPLTTDDVIFTVTRVQDPAIKSPLRASWDGVSTERVSETQMRFILPEPYAPFIENLTLGILPKHIWEHASSEELPFSQYNSEPIGSGPYQIADIGRNNSGIPVTYSLTPHKDYHLGTPRIARITLEFYPNEDALLTALTAGEIDSAGGLSPELLERYADAHGHIIEAPLPRTFALFFNQNEAPVLRDRAVRRALNAAVDRDALVAAVLKGYGEAIDTPIPPGFGIPSRTDELLTGDAAIEEARGILEEGGWRLDSERGVYAKETDDGTIDLSFSISTANSGVFETVARMLKERFAALGAEVDIRQYPQSELAQGVIRPRAYETLLFGTEVGRELDFFSFWHSSQRNDPGLNVALYANIGVDDTLSDARTELDARERTELYRIFRDEVVAEVPAIFLFVPHYAYVVPDELSGVSLTGISDPSERFTNAHAWYLRTDSVWPFFQK